MTLPVVPITSIAPSHVWAALPLDHQQRVIRFLAQLALHLAAAQVAQPTEEGSDAVSCHTVQNPSGSS